VSALREASVALARKGGYPVLSIERLFAIERVAAGIEARRIPGGLGAAELIERAEDKGLGALSIADLRRLLRAIWADRGRARLASALVERLAEDGRRSVDRALIATYLGAYPADHPAFERLRAAAAAAADRHDWAWRAAGQTWRLWEGIDTVGKALQTASDPVALLRDTGLVGHLANGAFVTAASASAARSGR
jgi:hypothetical protein